VNVRFKQRLVNGERLLGTILTLPSPEVAEVLSLAGLDWLFVDMEHTVFDVAQVQAVLQAVGGDFPCLVRVPRMDEGWVKKVLDAGPAGIIVPHIRSAAEVKTLLGWCRYPPEGIRSVGISRAQGYGLKQQEYLKTANRDLLVLPQVEDREAVENIASIAGVEGLEALFVGPYDLAGSLGKSGRPGDPEVLGLIEHVAACCSKSGLAAGIFSPDVETAGSYLGLGYTLIAVGTDTSHFLGSIRKTLREFPHE